MLTENQKQRFIYQPLAGIAILAIVAIIYLVSTFLKSIL